MVKLRLLMSALLLMSSALYGACEAGAQGTITSRYEDLALDGARLTIKVNVDLFRWNQLFIQAYPGDSPDDFTVRTRGWTVAGVFRDELDRWWLDLRREAIITHSETVVVEGPEGRGRLGMISLARNGFREITVTGQPTFLPTESVLKPPPGGGASVLKRFDLNGNDLIDDPEFFAIIDAWVAGRLDNPTFFRAVDLWVYQQLISAAKVQEIELMLSSTAQALDIVARGGGIASLALEVFRLDGRRLFTREELGPLLSWDLRAGDRPLANGVYLYVVRVRGLDGRLLKSEAGRLVVLR